MCVEVFTIIKVVKPRLIKLLKLNQENNVVIKFILKIVTKIVSNYVCSIEKLQLLSIQFSGKNVLLLFDCFIITIILVTEAALVFLSLKL